MDACLKPVYKTTTPLFITYPFRQFDILSAGQNIVAAGGKIVQPKTEISPEYGYMAIFKDTEGNRIALHSVPEKYLTKS